MNAKINRNDPCPCGSGKKYKKCCYEKDQAAKNPAMRLTPGKVKNLTDQALKTFTREIAGDLIKMAGGEKPKAEKEAPEEQKDL